MSYRPIPAPRQAEQVIASINTTPLIDVMLVLLIMFIMIVPVTHHKVPIDLPSGDGGLPPTIHRLELAAGGGLLWNGAPLSEQDLRGRLSTVTSDANAVLHFRTDGEARYEDFDRILADIKRAGIERLGLVDNGRFVEQ